MKLGLTHQDDKYGFIVVGTRFNRILFDSTKHHFMTSFLQSGYRYAWQAQRDGNKLLKRHSHHVLYAREDLTKPIITDISTEEMLENHYRGIYKGVEDKAHGSKKDSKEEREKVYNEIKIIRGELESVIENIEDKKTKKALGHVLVLYKQLIRKNFADLDRESKSKEMEAPPMPPAPMGPPMGAPSLMASAANHSLNNIKIIDEDCKDELLDFYGEKICKAIQNKHDGAHFIIRDSEEDTIWVYDSDNTPILCAGINEEMHVDKIIPLGKINRIHPFHSASFYQKYWKPIVEGLDHFYIDDASLLILPSVSPLPDIPSSDSENIIEGWNNKERKTGHVGIAFKGDGPLWFFNTSYKNKIVEAAQSRYKEQDYINAVVRCKDPTLASLFDKETGEPRTGQVVQIIPYEDFIEVDVDFGRGLGIVRLTEKQLEIVPLSE